MKKISFAITLIACLLVLAPSCKKNKTSKQDVVAADNSKNSLDWNGIYAGVLPCADCEGIQTTVVLKNDETYELRTRYMGKSHDVTITKGKFSWDKNGSQITLSEINPNEAPTKYVVGENKLIQLDLKGNKITGDNAGMYELQKVSDVVEKYWKLIEVNGKEVAKSDNQAREAHLILKLDDNRVNGSGGCNSFNGTYVLKNGNRISFSQMASTMMACLDMETESQFMKALEMTDNYAVKGDTLSLNRARMAPLARFVVVYL